MMKDNSPTSLTPGAEPFFFPGNEIGVIVLHGFTSTPQVIRTYGETLAHYGGFTVSGPLLAGHGTRKADLTGVTMLDWVRDVVQAVEKLEAQCHKLFITGQSLGGLLTLYMTAMYPDRFAGAIPINAPAMPPTPDQLATIFALDAPTEIANGEPDIKRPGVDQITYDAK